jgi:hypothetical protein
LDNMRPYTHCLLSAPVPRPPPLSSRRILTPPRPAALWRLFSLQHASDSPATSAETGSHYHIRARPGAGSMLPIGICPSELVYPCDSRRSFCTGRLGSGFRLARSCLFAPPSVPLPLLGRPLAAAFGGRRHRRAPPTSSSNSYCQVHRGKSGLSVSAAITCRTQPICNSRQDELSAYHSKWKRGQGLHSHSKPEGR